MKQRRISALFLTVMLMFSFFAANGAVFASTAVTFTALDGTGNNGANENYSKLLDGTTKTKWCDKFADDDGNTYVPYIIFKASEKVVITDYTFVTGNDNASNPGRNPKDWVLYGCNDYNESSKSGGSWAAIHTVTDDAVMQDENYASYKFSIDGNSTMYKYYKLEITANHGAMYNLMQLSEMQIDYKIVYNVTFDKNGGDTEAEPQIIQSGDGLPTTKPTRNDYRFIGWYTKNGSDDDWGEQFTAESTVISDMTVYAKWEKAYYVTFDLNGGTSETAIEPILHGDAIPTTGFVNENYKFGGWYTKDGSNDDWGEQYTADMVVTENITVYAKWNTINITFDKNGGATNANPNVTAGGEKLPATNPAKVGYKFVGWYTKNGADGDWGEQFTQEMSAAATENMTVYARWEAIIVTFDQNGGTSDGYPISLGWNEVPSSNPVKNGFEFVGWYTKDGSDGDWGNEFNEYYTAIDDITVYAKWTVSEYECTSDITLTALAGSGTNTKESYTMLVDGKKTKANHSKWFVADATDAYVILKASAYTVVTGYTMTTGNDTASQPGRNPKSWVLYGSNDYNESDTESGTWEAIHTVTDDTTMQAVNYTPYSFTTANAKAFKYYKLAITEVQDATKNQLQLEELEFTCSGCEHMWSTPTHTEPTCTESEYNSYTCANCALEYKVAGANAYGHTLGDDGKCTVCGHTYEISVNEDDYYDNLQTAINSAASNGYVIKLLADVEISTTVTFGNSEVEQYLDLNGHTIKMTGTGSVIKVSGAKLTVQDSSEDGTGKITGGYADYGGGINVESGTLTFEGGTIENCSAKSGGGIYNKGTLKMTGGNIISCSIHYNSGNGGGITSIGKLEMSGGTIKNCKAKQYGGGVYCDTSAYTTDGYFKMTGGTITENEAKIGGGVCSELEFTMSGGDITNNKAIEKGYGLGGGVCIQGDNYGIGKMIFNGGNITGNSAVQNGGGIYITYSGTLEMNGQSAVVSGNSAESYGGGIFAGYGQRATGEQIIMSNGSVYSNTAKKAGGGIAAYGTGVTATVSGGSIAINSAPKGSGISARGSSTVNISGGNITSNTSTDTDSVGGAVYVESSTLNLTGGTIQRNSVAGSGGGIYATDSSSLTLSGAYLTSNTAPSGGGIYCDGSTLDVNNFQIKGNTATEKGSGIALYNSTCEISGNTQIQSNGTGNGGCESGGGIWVSGTTTLTVNNIALNGNQAKTGAGMYLDKGTTVYLKGGNIMGNTSSVKASGIYCDTDKLYMDGAVGIYGNSKSSLYLANGNTINIRSLSITSESGTESKSQIWVTVEQGKNIYTDNPIDYSEYFTPDNRVDYKIKYDSGALKLIGVYDVYFNDATKVNVVTKDLTVKLYLAAYSENKLIDAVLCSVENNEDTITVSDTGLNTTGADEIRAFLWSGDATPLCKNASIEK